MTRQYLRILSVFILDPDAPATRVKNNEELKRQRIAKRMKVEIARELGEKKAAEKTIERTFFRKTGFHPSWSSLCHLGFFSGTSLRTRRLVPISYGNLRPAGGQTVWLLRFMLQLTT